MNVGGTEQILGDRAQNSVQQQYSGNRGQPKHTPLQPKIAPQQKCSGNNGKGNCSSQRDKDAQPVSQQPAAQSQPAGECDDLDGETCIVLSLTPRCV